MVKLCQGRMKTAIFITLLMLNLAVNFSSGEDEQPIVNVPTLGRLRGSQLSSASGKKFHAFRAIPYAEPPVGDLRFKVRQKINFPIFLGLI